MNVAPVAPLPAPARAADAPSPAAAAFGDLLAATPALTGAPATLTHEPASTPADPAPAASANEVPPAQPIAIKTPVADHPPAPKNDGPDAQPLPRFAAAAPGQPADTDTTATPVAETPAPSAPAMAPAPKPAAPIQTPVVVADDDATHMLSWQPAVADNPATSKPTGNQAEDGHEAPATPKTKWAKTDPTATPSSDAQQPQPAALAAMQTPAPQPIAGPASRQDDGGMAGFEMSAGNASAQPTPREGAASPLIHAGSDNLPPLLASQTPGAAIAPPAGQAPTYAPAAAAQATSVIAAEPGRMGRDIGVEIARNVAAGRDELTIRLSPAEMGRIEVRLSFDSKGALHAAVSADSPQALDMLRRDAGDLGRSLADAGIRTDSSSFSFGSRDSSAGQFAQQHHHHGHSGGDGRSRYPGAPLQDADGSEPSTANLSPYRQLHASGRVDLMA